MIVTSPNPQITKATAQIEAFKNRFGEEHLYLAYHVAFPLTFTATLAYKIWEKFNHDINGKPLYIHRSK